MARNDPEQVTRHHIIPSSRIQGKPITGICKVKRWLHELYHNLFGNMTPYEIGQWLNETFWNCEYEITIRRKRNF